ncbi:hypothetical protein GW17_00050779 [Ensete ventricosum]|nr:hypothetical protein GW17_00050779 [Ensete ventricosum]
MCPPTQLTAEPKALLARPRVQSRPSYVRHGRGCLTSARRDDNVSRYQTLVGGRSTGKIHGGQLVQDFDAELLRLEVLKQDDAQGVRCDSMATLHCLVKMVLSQAFPFLVVNFILESSTIRGIDVI